MLSVVFSRAFLHSSAFSKHAQDKARVVRGRFCQRVAPTLRRDHKTLNSGFPAWSLSHLEHKPKDGLWHQKCIWNLCNTETEAAPKVLKAVSPRKCLWMHLSIARTCRFSWWVLAAHLQTVTTPCVWLPVTMALSLRPALTNRLWWSKDSTKLPFVLACKDWERTDYLCFLETAQWWSSKYNLLLRLLFNNRANGKGLASLKLKPSPAVKMTHPRSELSTTTPEKLLQVSLGAICSQSNFFFSLSVNLYKYFILGLYFC